jgi:hypothetical protein
METLQRYKNVELQAGSLEPYWCSAGAHATTSSPRLAMSVDEPAPIYACEGCLTTYAIKIASYRKRKSNEETRLVESGRRSY